tara:strand:+ start:2408 stop:3154 length:747 start_codon:yes stop_codon:yes gene_type:complete
MFNLQSKSKDLSSFVEGKRVAVVGPGGYLTGKNQGRLIDSYDVVIRPNSFSIPMELRKDYGSRTDIMFHNCGTPWMIGLKELIAKNPDEFDQLKMVVCPVIKADHSETNFMAWSDDHKSACATNFSEVNRNNIPFYWIGVKDYKTLYNVIGCQPYTGILTIMMLSHHWPKELYVTGFDFYSGSKVYYDGILASNEKHLEHANRNGNHGAGCNNRQIEFLRDWIFIGGEFHDSAPRPDHVLFDILTNSK